jgi:subtilase family serine protease
MRFLASFLLFALLAVSFVSGGVLYTRDSIPHGWHRLNAASPIDRVSFMVGLKNRNLDTLEKMFWEVSDPDHAEYQNYKSIEEIAELVAPTWETQQKVLNFFVERGVKKENIVNYADAIEVVTTAATASKIFNTEFYHFRSVSGRKVIAAVGDISLPDEIHQNVQLLEGVSYFPVEHLKWQKAPHQRNQRHLLQLNDIGVIPQSLADLYNIRAETTGASPSTSQGVIEFEGQSFSTVDLLNYGTATTLNIQNVSASNIVGPNIPSQPGVEATLDIQFMAGVNREATSWFWIEGGQGWLYQFGTHFFNTSNVPQVSSISYGWWEGDQCEAGIGQPECQSLGVNSQQYVAAVNTLFMKIGLRGLTLLASSGDSGANGRTDGTCSVPQLRAAFPSSSPYITSVGANQLSNPQFNLPNSGSIPACQAGYPCVSGGTEVAVSYNVSGFASGGGFSNYSSTPSYQKSAVAAYLSSGVKLPPASYFNAQGRGAPDISAIGHNCMISSGGQLEAVGGTSCSSPIAGAVFALLNQDSISASGKPLGFLNPLIYKAVASQPSTFNDVLTGDNICTEDGCTPGCTGFLATKGWDPVTGVGSPNYSALKQYITAMHAQRKAKFGQ